MRRHPIGNRQGTGSKATSPRDARLSELGTKQTSAAAWHRSQKGSHRELDRLPVSAYRKSALGTSGVLTCSAARVYFPRSSDVVGRSCLCRFVRMANLRPVSKQPTRLQRSEGPQRAPFKIFATQHQMSALCQYRQYQSVVRPAFFRLSKTCSSTPSSGGKLRRNHRGSFSDF